MDASVRESSDEVASSKTKTGESWNYETSKLCGLVLEYYFTPLELPEQLLLFAFLHRTV